MVPLQLQRSPRQGRTSWWKMVLQAVVLVAMAWERERAKMMSNLIYSGSALNSLCVHCSATMSLFYVFSGVGQRPLQVPPAANYGFQALVE